MIVCSTDRLYHYLLGGDAALGSIRERGLLPLSAMPESELWRALERDIPGFYLELYALFAEPVLGRPYGNSGVFLTPIDFRRMPDLPLAARTRIAVPLAALDTGSAALTYELDGRRTVLPVSAATLEETARLWPEGMVRSWFGRDPGKLFLSVPQVASYREGGIRVLPEWVER
jgi:hypothetical protein